MNTRKFLLAVVATALAVVPALVGAQRALHVDPDHFKVDKHKADVHPRRLAFNNKDGRHQPRVMSRTNRHKSRVDVRGATHHLTAPHHPTKH